MDLPVERRPTINSYLYLGAEAERGEDPDRAEQGGHDRHRPDDARPRVPHVVPRTRLRDPRGGQGLHQGSESL